MRRLIWILGALAGVVLAAAVSYAASSLSTQHIGLSSEPPSAGSRLAPARTATPTPKATARPRRKPRKRPATPTPSATPTPLATPVPTVDDHGGESGRGRGRGRGGGSDD